MAKTTKYGIPSLKRNFPTDEACLEYIFDTLHCRRCSCGGSYSSMKNSRKFQCSKCRFKISPTANTIFDHSPTPLTLWFQALLVFSNAKSGISAAQMERELEVTYKCAWRILMLVRNALKQSKERLKGDVETDAAYFGGRKNAGKNNEFLSMAIKDKSVVMGAVERGGNAALRVVPDATAKSHSLFLRDTIENRGTRLMTDRTNRLDAVAMGYDRHSVDHHKKEFVRGDIHVNTLDSFLAHVKRSIKGTHKVLSKRYLQNYLDGFVWHYNKRYNDRQRFFSLLDILLRDAG